ncbi:40S ribosomal protein S9 [Pseudomassariella vexata]|uniref:Small ribosomal subunit protein uS9m n=1 Tax=Pseudomassariella vexata TaxID=1141098 RepID=A0A1Y2EI63_9PEZI|nr:40S ribosomal protein S9 [Pseudomassariella vexata]ORY71260.1 40S ribosomal protein S9 [Pseudomassariella vexata]
MSALRHSFRCLREFRPASGPQWPSATTALAYRTRTSSPSTSRYLSTTTPRPAILGDDIHADKDIAIVPASRDTPGKNEHSSSGGNGAIQIAYARAVPHSPSYFSRQPIFNDSFVVIQDLARKYGRLPILPKDKVALTAWKTKEQYRLAAGEHVKGRDYATCMTLAKRLNQIHPDLKPDEVKEGLAPFMRDINYHKNRPKIVPVDRFGRSHGVGRRKSSVARAWVVEGNGEVLVNGKPLSEAFGRIHDRESAVWALKSTDRLDKYNVWGLVEGGGTTGQAEAMALAVAKALCTHEPALKNPLRRAGCITRDPRRVERKKHGHVKARKMPTWVKR